MAFKSTKLYGILTGTCPRCHEGKVFMNPNPYKLSAMFKVKEKCSCCGLKFEPEPSFYMGAMYVGYAFSVAIVIAIFVIANFFYEELPINSMIFWGILIAVLFAPMNIRLSRSIWLAVFFVYRPELAQKKEEN